MFSSSTAPIDAGSDGATDSGALRGGGGGGSGGGGNRSPPPEHE
jgi:hypothetical protein